jgi:hypothetical protein
MLGIDGGAVGLASAGTAASRSWQPDTVANGSKSTNHRRGSQRLLLEDRPSGTSAIQGLSIIVSAIVVPALLAHTFSPAEQPH